MSKKDRIAYNAYMREYLLRRYHERRSRAIERLGGKCVRCGSSERLELDHIERTQKSFDLAKHWSRSEEVFDKEVGKCQLLCRRCHGLKTLEDMGRVSAKENHGTLSSYRYCKCEQCQAAKRKYMAEYHKRKVVNPPSNDLGPSE